jgi:hypothetical protein
MEAYISIDKYLACYFGSFCISVAWILPVIDKNIHMDKPYIHANTESFEAYI